MPKQESVSFQAQSGRAGPEALESIPTEYSAGFWKKSDRTKPRLPYTTGRTSAKEIFSRTGQMIRTKFLRKLLDSVQATIQKCCQIPFRVRSVSGFLKLICAWIQKRKHVIGVVNRVRIRARQITDLRLVSSARSGGRCTTRS